VSCKM